MSKSRKSGRKDHPINPFDEPTPEKRDPKPKRQPRDPRLPRDPRTKVRSDIAGQRPLVHRPVLTDDIAMQFVRILAAGIPAEHAIVYFGPDHYESIDVKARDRWLRDWTTSPLVTRALVKFNGAAWEELDPDRRLQLGLDKALAGLAYFLYTHDYETCDGVDLKKHDGARKDLMDYLKLRSTGDDDAPWMKAMRAIVEGTIKEGLPPTLGPISTPRVTVKES